MKTQYDWVFVKRLTSEHRIFRDALSTKLAICDNSGSTPSQAEDGVLWLDPREGANVCWWPECGAVISLRVEGSRISDSRVSVNLEDAEALHELGFPLFLHESVAKHAMIWHKLFELFDGTPDNPYIRTGAYAPPKYAWKPTNGVGGYERVDG